MRSERFPAAGPRYYTMSSADNDNPTPAIQPDHAPVNKPVDTAHLPLGALFIGSRCFGCSFAVCGFKSCTGLHRYALMFIVFTVFLLLEHYRYRNAAAKHSGGHPGPPAIGLLLEFANTGCTCQKSLFFSLGWRPVVVFGVASRFYPPVHFAAAEKRLEYEVAAVNASELQSSIP